MQWQTSRRHVSPLSEPVTKPKATWVEPVIEAEIAYSTMTENALLREAVFKGLSESPATRTPGARPRRTAGTRGKPQPRSER